MALLLLFKKIVSGAPTNVWDLEDDSGYWELEDGSGYWDLE